MASTLHSCCIYVCIVRLWVMFLYMDWWSWWYMDCWGCWYVAPGLPNNHVMYLPYFATYLPYPTLTLLIIYWALLLSFVLTGPYSCLFCCVNDWALWLSFVLSLTGPCGCSFWCYWWSYVPRSWIMGFTSHLWTVYLVWWVIFVG